MGTATAVALSKPSPSPTCRLVVRENKGLSEVVEFVRAGLEIGQQVVTMAGPTCLKDLAESLGRLGLRPETLLRNGRLVFLTAPDCLPLLTFPQDPLKRAALRLNGSVLRWVSDWSWAYGNGLPSSTVLNYQSQVHEFVRVLTPLSLCTVHCSRLGRSSLLAVMADHRRAARGERPVQRPV